MYCRGGEYEMTVLIDATATDQRNKPTDLSRRDESDAPCQMAGMLATGVILASPTMGCVFENQLSEEYFKSHRHSTIFQSVKPICKEEYFPVNTRCFG